MKKQEQSLDDDYEMTSKEVWAMIGIVTVAMLVYYAVGYGVWNLAVYLTK